MLESFPVQFFSGQILGHVKTAAACGDLLDYFTR